MSADYDQVANWIRGFAASVAEHRDELTKLDQAIGDGDHGTNMDRGMRKAVERLDTLEGNDAGAALKAVGMALVSSVGGAGGPLYGTFFMQAGTALAGREEVDTAAFAGNIHIDGEWVPGEGGRIASIEPATGETLVEVGIAGPGDVARAAEGAVRAPGYLFLIVILLRPL
jgi:dihydroxyacetone kinase-like protein